jgi:hypothetical protein
VFVLADRLPISVIALLHSPPEYQNLRTCSPAYSVQPIKSTQQSVGAGWIDINRLKVPGALQAHLELTQSDYLLQRGTS